MTHGFFLSIEPDQWQIAAVRDSQIELRCVKPPAENDASDEDSLGAALRQMKYDGSPICLGVHSGLVFCAQIDCANLPRKQRRQAMIYRLALGVAIDTAAMRQTLDRLEALGVEVASICPTALLALWQAVHGRQLETDFVMLADGSRIETFRLSDSQVAAWHSTSDSPQEIARAVQADLLIRPVESASPRLILLGKLPKDVEFRLTQRIPLQIGRDEEASVVPAAAQAAMECLRKGRRAGWVDLRTDALAPQNVWKPLRGLVRAAVLLSISLTIVLTAAFCWKAWRYGKIADVCRDGQEAEFRKVYPNSRVPTNVRSRLKSELSRLAGLSGAGIDVPAQPNALENLRRLTAELPRAMRLRVLEMRMGTGGLLLEGQVRSHGDAEVIFQSLKRAGFGVEAPKTEHLVNGGVSFTIAGKLAEAAREGTSP